MASAKFAWTGLLTFSAAMLAVQFVPARRTNPPSQGELSAPSEIEVTLRRACYDCHSNATRWPWYSRVAPFSWLIVRDVTRGRREVNFSEWGAYFPLTRRRKLQWIGRALREHKMPPWPYRLMHPAARLTEADRAALERWVESELATPPVERSNK
jgi:Haem-binding domain